MLQLTALLIISWMVLWIFEKKDLTILGLLPTKKLITFFILLLIVSALCSLLAFLLRMYFAKEVYALNLSLTFTSIVTQLWYQLRTVLTEELLCRGVLLYILIKRLGGNKAIIISSVVFAVLHWLNAGVWGNFMQMLIVFAFTFSMGLLLAWAYAKTFSLLIPFAIHFGWNVMQNYIFPGTTDVEHLFVLSAPPPVVTISYLSFFTMILLPKVLVLVTNYFIVKQHRQVAMP
ncbi:MAG: CPBP family intramembrane metalloprotease [Sphingobacteriales bacterium]|nr:CPBP family intramembrane metalloprotease [Sphingobacteriales bacterium]